MLPGCQLDPPCLKHVAFEKSMAAVRKSAVDLNPEAAEADPTCTVQFRETVLTIFSFERGSRGFALLSRISRFLGVAVSEMGAVNLETGLPLRMKVMGNVRVGVAAPAKGVRRFARA